MMYLFWFLMGFLVAGAVFYPAFEKMCDEFDEEVGMYQRFIRGIQAKIEVIDETSKD